MWFDICTLTKLKFTVSVGQEDQHRENVSPQIHLCCGEIRGKTRVSRSRTVLVYSCPWKNRILITGTQNTSHIVQGSLNNMWLWIFESIIWADVGEKTLKSVLLKGWEDCLKDHSNLMCSPTWPNTSAVKLSINQKPWSKSAIPPCGAIIAAKLFANVCGELCNSMSMCVWVIRLVNV